MPKKAPRGAFFFFLIDYKKRCEQNGERFPNGLKDEYLKETAGAEWKVLTPQMKKPYEDMAKEEKIRLKGQNGGYRETNMHRSFQSVDRQKLEEEEEKNVMLTFIENCIASSATSKSLAAKTFYLMHANYFCVSNNMVYHPAELAIVEFSLLDGVKRTFHRIIDPGEFPLGTYHEAKQKSEGVHKIPLSGNGGEQDFARLLSDIQDFMKPGRDAITGQLPPVFTMADNSILNTSEKCIRSIFNTLTDISAAGAHEPNFRVYSLEKLFFELKNACHTPGDNHNFPLMSLAQMELEKDIFKFTSHIACDFHQRIDAVDQCSKSFVQRWVFIICDHCCKSIDIEVKPGSHVPFNADTNYRETRKNMDVKNEPKKFTWIDHSKPATSHDFVPVDHEPLPQIRSKPNLAAMRKPDPSELNFPMMSLGRGRSSGSDRAPLGRGYTPLSFAAAAKK